ncbi:MAG: asparagine synthase (glutamine-hydrolyzing) [Mucilaginibacter polytrichastri]|nr:asparagine synthase (glutamine-hydrolyzing) [Mucilaginibacter polytrichastri]
MRADEAAETIRRMTHIQAHGGPDGEGFFTSENHRVFFGHRRLSVIDPAQGQQPMPTQDGSAVITFNGEIYNYRELRDELQRAGAWFQTGSDTEVILMVYKKWGEKGFEKLDGMFAFGLFDKQKNLVFLVRDMSGIKPLYWANDKGNAFAFASETRALAGIAVFTPENPDWKILLLAFGHIPEPVTRYKHVRMLEKGHYLQYDLNTDQFTTTAFRQSTYLPKQHITAEEARREIRRQVERGVTSQLVADVPLGIFLSGGIDSSIVSLVAAKSHQQTRTLSVIFNESDFSERKYQQLIAGKAGSVHFEYTVTRNDLARNFTQIVDGMDQPTTDGINTWFISRAAKENGLKVVLSGLGGDEIFGGYPSFNRIRLLQNMRMIPPPFLRAAQYLNNKTDRIGWLENSSITGDYLFLRGYFSPVKTASILGISVKEVFRAIERVSPPKIQQEYNLLQGGDRASFLEYHYYMQNQLLRDSDAMSMQHGIELRVPLLDQQVIQSAMVYPQEIKYGGQPKRLLIESFSDILPESLYNRPKMGFSFPLQEWMRSLEPIAMLSSHKNPAVRRIVADFLNNKTHWSKAFALYHVCQES